jgi:uncharacterized protein
MRALLLVAALLGSTSAYAQDTRGSIITTTGSAQEALTPTAARIIFIIETHASSASIASGDNGARQQRVVEAMRRQGFSGDQVQLTSFDVRSNMDYQRGRIVDYQASATVSVVLKPIAHIGMVIDSALAAGATEVQDIDFSSDSTAIVRERLLMEAVGAARRDAEALARAVGGQLGMLVDVSSAQCTGGDRISEILALQPGVIGRTSSIADITPGKVKTQVTVCTRWQLSK